MFRQISVLAIRLTLLSGAIAAAQSNAPFVLEQDAAYTVAFGDQLYGAITAGPDRYFAMWVDLRVGGANPAGWNLHGQLGRPDGTVKSPGILAPFIDLLSGP